MDTSVCDNMLPPTHAPVTVLTRAQLVATMERPGSMISVRPEALTMSRTVLIKSVGVGNTSFLKRGAEKGK